jgi:hypothetical protein
MMLQSCSVSRADCIATAPSSAHFVMLHLQGAVLRHFGDSNRFTLDGMHLVRCRKFVLCMWRVSHQTTLAVLQALSYDCVHLLLTT